MQPRTVPLRALVLLLVPGTTSAALVLGAPAAAPAAHCGSDGDTDFPLTAELRGGPAAFTPGAGYRSFRLELGNTTEAACDGIHPLLVFVDRERRLDPGDIILGYADPRTAAWRSVPFEETEQDEIIGIVGGESGPGLTVPPGGTVTVRLRLRFSRSTAPDRVSVLAAAMQRQGDDGAWVGESKPYTFSVVPRAKVSAGTAPAESPAQSGLPERSASSKPSASSRRSGPSVSSEPPGPSRLSSPSARSGPPRSPESSKPPGHPALAATGVRAGLVAAAAALVATGVVLIRASRRRRPGSRRPGGSTLT